MLWDKDEPIFDMRFTDDGTRLAGIGTRGVFMYNAAGTQLWHFDPGHEQSLLPDLLDMSTDGAMVSAVLFPPRDFAQSGDLVSGLTPTNHTLYILSGQTGTVLWQNPFGEIGLPDADLSSDGRTLAVGGSKMLRTYDLTLLLQLPQGGDSPNSPNGPGAPF